MRVHAPDFSLAETLASGQLFRWRSVADGFIVSHRAHAMHIEQRGDTLLVHAATPNVTPAWITHFFALDQPLPEAVDAPSAAALAACAGMRVCRQDPWECTIAFLCSQNNNVKRIQQLMQGLADAFGMRVKLGNYEVALFPEPGAIRSGARLRAIKLGYREKYIVAANALTDAWLAQIRMLNPDDARTALRTLPGVGPKVAECILLFAYGVHDAFPIDTWVDRIMREDYGARSHAEMRALALERFGANAGIMQQYLFHHRRTQ